MARVARRRRKSAKAIDAVREARAEAQRLADRRGVAYTRQALALLSEALAAMLTPDVLDAVERGETGAMRAALRRPPTGLAVPLLKRAAVTAWAAGREEGIEDLRRLRIERFDDMSRAAILERRAARAEEYRAAGPELKQFREMARQIMRSFASHTRDELGDELARAREREDSALAFRDARTMLEDIKAGRPVSPTMRRFIRGVEGRLKSVVATPILEVDWRVARRAETQAWQEVKTETMLLEAGTAGDDEVTPWCQFADMLAMVHDDPRAHGEYAWGAHYNCRTKWVVRRGEPDEANWDERITKVIGEPRAGAEQQATYTNRASDFKIPAGAPNVPPPATLAEWL